MLKHYIEHDLPKIDAPIRKRIFRAIERLAKAPEILGDPLKYEFKGFYKFRVGDWRIIYEIRQNELVVLVIKIGHRREVYKR